MNSQIMQKKKRRRRQVGGDRSLYIVVTSEVEPLGGRERDFNEVGVLELTIKGEVVKHRGSQVHSAAAAAALSFRVGLGRFFPPCFDSARAYFCVSPLL